MNECKVCGGIKGIHGSVLPGCSCAQSYTPNQQYQARTVSGTGDYVIPTLMTLRDYFAGQALAGLASYPNWYTDPSGFAEDAYRMADAMLKARGGA